MPQNWPKIIIGLLVASLPILSTSCVGGAFFSGFSGYSCYCSTLLEPGRATLIEEAAELACDKAKTWYFFVQEKSERRCPVCDYPLIFQ